MSLEIPTKCPHCNAVMATETKVETDGSVETHLFTVEVFGKPKYWHCWKCECSWEIGNRKPIVWWECD